MTEWCHSIMIFVRHINVMVFNLLCMPCFAAVGAMKRELKTIKDTGIAVGVQMLTAYIVAFVIYNIGMLIS